MLHGNRLTDHSSIWRLALVLLLSSPTPEPAAANRETLLPSIAQVQINPRTGFYNGSILISLGTQTSAARIYYTTNGAGPSPTSGRLYEQPIAVNHTTILRAAAAQDGFAPGEMQTRSYFFSDDVFKQTGAGWPATWGTNQNQAVPADYEMDPEIVNRAKDGDRLERALRSIASLSIAMNPHDLFDPAHGIYARPNETGSDWERRASAELVYPDGRPGFQIDCGIRIQGGWNRRPEESPKHSFRLLFKRQYGPAKLKFPLFGESGVREFETLVLRSGCNNTWLHWNAEERRRGDFIRDQWARDTALAMGHPSARGLFVHLFLNGLYWGLYNLTERPSAPFAAAHLGGSPRDYDSRNADKILEGDADAWKRMMGLAHAGLGGEQAYRAIQEYIDMPSLIDFLIVNFYGANADWDRASNWYAARRRRPPGKFQFFVWDAERTLEEVEANSLSYDDDESPARLFHKLRENAEFRIQFADRVQRHFFDGGALTPAVAAKRFEVWANEIDSAVILESARWGDYRREVHPYRVGPYELYTREEHWRPEVDRLLKQYFPQRAAVVLEQFRERGLYPEIAPPNVRRLRDRIALSAPSGAVYLTLDGSDPRLPGGGLSTAAAEYKAPIAHPGDKKLKARTLAESPGRREWSALAEF